jgi:hypothetical protein
MIHLVRSQLGLLRERILPVKRGWRVLFLSSSRKCDAGGTSMMVETRMVATRIVEMRTYKTKPGKRPEFLEIFRAKSIPAHAEIGM